MSFDPLIRTVFERTQLLKDARKRNGDYSVADATMSAVAMFSLKDPSLLVFQNRRTDQNMRNLFCIQQVPSDTQIRQEHPHLKLIAVEDGLASNAPHIQLLKSLQMHFILGVKPDDHKYVLCLLTFCSKGLVTIRWVYVIDLDGMHRDECFFSTDSSMSPTAIIEMFGGRWNIETNFGHVRTTMKMEVLKCKTVDGVLPELHAFALIYNLIRQVMMRAAERQAAESQKVPINRISFIDAMRWLDAAQPGDELGKLVVLPDRPNRYEPRVRKRRPKNYKLMNKPRQKLKKELAA